MAVSGILDAAGRLHARMPVSLVDEWTAQFRAPEVHEHPIVATNNKRWENFVPPNGRQHPPLWTCVAWLVSSPVSSGDDTSELVVSWFADQLDDLEAAIVRAASKLDWEKHAQAWAF